MRLLAPPLKTFDVGGKGAVKGDGVLHGEEVTKAKKAGYTKVHEGYVIDPIFGQNKNKSRNQKPTKSCFDKAFDEIYDSLVNAYKELKKEVKNFFK